MDHSSRYVVLDRDGTVNVERHYLSDPDAVELLPGTAKGLRMLQDSGFRLAIITNQSAIARGYIDVEALERIHRRLTELLAESGIVIERIYYCPHLPSDQCNCRKPRTGLLQRAAAELGFAPEETFVVGDKASDIEMGRALGAKTILVRAGYGREEEAAQRTRPDYVADDLLEAARCVVRSQLARRNDGAAAAQEVRL